MKKLALLAFVLASLSAPFLASADETPPSGHEETTSPGNMAVWFEIPVADMDRAVAFYSAIFQFDMTVNNHNGIPMAFFPGAGESVTGALIKMEEMVPGATGPVLYLNGGADLQIVLDRVEPAGGTVIVPKTLISVEIGYFAIFLDTEGNRLGLFSEI